MCKCQEFSITQILREINFEDSGRLKNAVFATLGALDSVDLTNFGLKKCKNS